MSDSIFSWSTTASDNDDADSTINWSEGQNPSTVNNSARALMARVSEFLSDITSAKTTAGTGAAYTVTATQQPASLPDGFTLLILPHADNTGTCTINVNGLGAKALRSTSAENMAAGVLKANQPALVAYRQSSDEFLVLAGGNAEGTQFNWLKGADVASAAALDLGTDGNSFDITGTTSITSIGTLGVGTLVMLQFDDALTLTHHATDLVLPGAADIVTAAGDVAFMWEYASGDWQCVGYMRNDGTALRDLDIAPSKNYIVNPGMRISQENGSSSGTANGYYLVDQWATSHIQDGTLTFQQVSSATPGGSENRIRMTVTSADTSIAAGQYAFITQYIEGLRTADLQWGTANATDVVLRFGFKGPAGTYAVALKNQDVNRTFIREFTISGGDANTDTLQTLTFPGDTSGTWDKDNTSSFLLLFIFAAGSTWQTTPDAWQAGNYLGTSSTSNGIGTTSDVFEIFDVGLYADPDSTGLAPRFELPHYDTDLQECQRYYHKGFVSIRAYAAASGYVYANRAYFPNSMRVGPSISGPTGGFVSGNISSNTLLDPEIDSVENHMVTSGAGDAYCTRRSYIANARM